MMKHLRGWKTRVVHTDGRIDSWTDGSIFRGTAGVDLFKNVAEHDDVLPFALCTDSTVVKLGAQTSLTPCTCDNLALPLWLRMVFQSKFLWAVLPEGAKPNALYALPFLEDGARFRTGTEGIDIDGTFRVFVTIAHLISDTRGVGSMLNCKEIGSIIGACQQCTVTAYVNKQLGSQYYPSAIRTTPQESPQRVAFETLYRKLPLLAARAQGPTPRSTTHAQLMASATRAETICALPVQHGTGTINKANLKKEPMKGHNPYTATFGLDIVVQNVTDAAHAIDNTVRDCFTLFDPAERGRNTCYVSRKVKGFLNAVGQTQAGTTPAWQASASKSKHVNHRVIPYIRTRLPSSWAGLAIKLRKNSTSQNLLLAGDLGCYILRFYDLPPPSTQLFVRLFRVMESLMREGYSNTSLNLVEADLKSVLAQAEVMLPLIWCTGVRHYLLHACTYIRRCGPFREHNMLVFERWHTIFKRMARGRRNLIASIHSHWYHTYYARLNWICICIVEHTRARGTRARSYMEFASRLCFHRLCMYM